MKILADLLENRAVHPEKKEAKINLICI